MKNIFKDLKKIEWTTPKDLLVNYIIVVLFSTIVTLMIYGIDTVVVYVQKLLMTLI